MQEAITLASPAARIVLMGFSSDPSQIVQQGITGKELSIFSSRLNANKFPVVIDWLEKGLIDPEKLVTHTFDYHHVTDAIELFEKTSGSAAKSCSRSTNNNHAVKSLRRQALSGTHLTFQR